MPRGGFRARRFFARAAFSASLHSLIATRKSQAFSCSALEKSWSCIAYLRNVFCRASSASHAGTYATHARHTASPCSLMARDMSSEGLMLSCVRSSSQCCLAVGAILGALATADEAAASAVAVAVSVAATVAVGAGAVAIAVAVSVSVAVLGAGIAAPIVAVSVV